MRKWFKYSLYTLIPALVWGATGYMMDILHQPSNFQQGFWISLGISVLYILLMLDKPDKFKQQSADSVLKAQIDEFRFLMMFFAIGCALWPVSAITGFSFVLVGMIFCTDIPIRLLRFQNTQGLSFGTLCKALILQCVPCLIVGLVFFTLWDLLDIGQMTSGPLFNGFWISLAVSVFFLFSVLGSFEKKGAPSSSGSASVSKKYEDFLFAFKALFVMGCLSTTVAFFLTDDAVILFSLSMVAVISFIISAGAVTDQEFLKEAVRPTSIQQGDHMVINLKGMSFGEQGNENSPSLQSL